MLAKYCLAAFIVCLVTVRGDIQASSRGLEEYGDGYKVLEGTDLPPGGNAFETITGESPEEASTLETAPATGYTIIVDGITITDVSTGLEDILCIHNNNPFDVYADIVWDGWDGPPAWVPDSDNTILYETSLNDVVQAKGTIELVEHQPIPTKFFVGQMTTSSTGFYKVEVKVTIDGVESPGDRAYKSFAGGASFVPLILIIFLAATTNMVELSLGFGIFVGCCMVAGSLTQGFRDMLAVYIVSALADESHVYVITFILFMAGLVGIIEKSGGLEGITVSLQKYVKTNRSAQLASFCAGLIIFFDDYSNTLVAGSSMRPLTDASVVSREKLAFIVDATSAPIASIMPISSWIGFEIGLIQVELDKIVEQVDPNSVLGNTSSFKVFLETIAYRYYCIFMILFIPMVIFTGRDFGPMLTAERLTKVYGRTDGGPGKALAVDGGVMVNHNAPNEDIPKKWYNMAFPITMLIVYIFYLLVWTGQTSPYAVGDENFVEIMSLADAYTALLWGTMAGALTACLFYFIQDHKDGKIIWFNFNGYKNKIQRFIARKKGIAEEDGEVHARVLLNVSDAMTSFIVGMEKIFGALVVLILAWATGSIMVSVGLNRFFGHLITNDALDYRLLPTLTFVISIMIAFATGSSWGTMTIMFPLVVVPAYEASNGDPETFYGVIAGILAGAVAGDHASPISDTTVLAAMASGCEVIQHVKTQGPYAFIVALWSILVGTLPVGFKAYPNYGGIALGALAMAFHAFVTAAPTINKTGSFDPFTELYIKCLKEGGAKDFYTNLKADVIEAYETGRPVALPEGVKILETIHVPGGKSRAVDQDLTRDSETGYSDKPEAAIDVGLEVDPEPMSISAPGNASVTASNAEWASFVKHMEN